MGGLDVRDLGRLGEVSARIKAFGPERLRVGDLVRLNGLGSIPSNIKPHGSYQVIEVHTTYVVVTGNYNIPIEAIAHTI